MESAGIRPSRLEGAAAEFDRRFRDAVADDLDLPRAVEVLSETVSSGIPEGEKFALLTSWDAALGLDLERLAREGGELPQEVQALVRERDDARAAGDFDRSDAMRERLATLGYELMDTPQGTRVRRRG